ncbi:hypothetical protein NC651_013790 [Populus alba x Populus x berolinensis]|nr:hypothetical protein NC651_013790 [Populus alba x Populus x berolinensis]
MAPGITATQTRALGLSNQILEGITVKNGREILKFWLKDKGIQPQVNVFAQQHSWIPPTNGQIKFNATCILFFRQNKILLKII